MMGYEHNKKKIEDERVCVWSHMEHWLCYFFTINYYCSPLILNDFMCGQNIVICNGGVRGRGRGEGRVVVEAVPLIFYI